MINVFFLKPSGEGETHISAALQETDTMPVLSASDLLSAPKRHRASRRKKAKAPCQEQTQKAPLQAKWFPESLREPGQSPTSDFQGGKKSSTDAKTSWTKTGGWELPPHRSALELLVPLRGTILARRYYYPGKQTRAIQGSDTWIMTCIMHGRNASKAQVLNQVPLQRWTLILKIPWGCTSFVNFFLNTFQKALRKVKLFKPELKAGNQ